MQPAIACGVLLRLLPRWRFVPMPVTAVTPHHDAEPAKVRVAVDALKRHFSGLPGSGGTAGPD